MQTKKIHFGAFSRFKPYLLRYPKEIIGAFILGILSGFFDCPHDLLYR